MDLATQVQVVDRLKREPCQQEDCLSGHQDNVELIVFGTQKSKRTGMMCCACFLDSQMIGKLMPVEKFVLPIRKFMSLIVSFYKDYDAMKKSEQWGPSLVKTEGVAIQRRIELFYNDGLKSALEISQFAQSVAKKAETKLRQICQDSDFDKIVQFLNQQNQMEQERIAVGGQLTSICGKIRLSEGKLKYATEQSIRRETQELLDEYRSQMSLALSALKELTEVYRDCLKRVQR